MIPRTKIFVVEHDCAKLVNLMLWLDQYPEFEITGVVGDTRNIHQHIAETNPDIVLLDVDSTSGDRVTTVRSLKASPNAPAVVVLCPGEKDKALLAESDGCVQQTSSIQDLCEFLQKASNKRRTAIAAANMPKTKAG
jgi:DNA-binding NarL/FixJ family response regulator